MASLNFCIFLDKCEPKKLSFTVNSSQLSGCCSVSLFAGYVHITGVCIVKPFSNFNHIRVSKLQTDLSDVSESNLVDLEVSDQNNCSVSENLVPKFKKGRRNIWKRFRGLKKVNKDVNLKHVSGSSGDNFEKEEEPIFVFGGNVVNFMSNGKTELNFDLGSIGPDSSVESCNFTLRQLERGGEDRKALRFFEWMRSNGKLMHNWNAYNIVLRVLSRRDDWYGAEKMIDQMINVSGCELGFQIFNTLIYSCHK